MNRLSKLLLAIVICEGVGLISAPFTSAAIPTWYAGLEKPVFSPPNWLFAPVWTSLYLLMALSAYRVWIRGTRAKKVRVALLFFLIQLLLNFLWSPLFFGLRAPLLALVEIGLLWVAIIITIFNFHRVDHRAAYLLLPYLIWVSFAMLLNFSIVMLNPA
ncbi:tryptophan-rich sensory protein [Patescibacteria group bacterium]|nr:tryptophan-rich sensory protein [Patescibacteria group bacterium]MCL5091327.1 tryptophan-rich sensory protein [Patescibacteria group bacterium]